MGQLTDVEKDLLKRMPSEYAPLESEDPNALWTLERRGLIEGRVRPTELATLTEMEWRISAQGLRMRAEGGYRGMDSAMYRLQQLAPGSYDLERDGELIGSVVRSGFDTGAIRWYAELLTSDVARPPPFTEPEHEFRSLEEVVSWLGDAEVNPTYKRRDR